jgi:hypothetical protein
MVAGNWYVNALQEALLTCALLSFRHCSQGGTATAVFFVIACLRDRVSLRLSSGLGKPLTARFI